MGINLALVGFLLLISPAIMAWRDGIRDPNELVTWIMDRANPFRFAQLISLTVIFGLGLMLFGGMWSLFPEAGR
jgi:hypothetical protein